MSDIDSMTLVNNIIKLRLVNKQFMYFAFNKGLGCESNNAAFIRCWRKYSKAILHIILFAQDKFVYLAKFANLVNV